MTNPYYGGSQHGDTPPAASNSIIAYWLLWEQAQRDAQRDAEQARQEQQVQDDLPE